MPKSKYISDNFLQYRRLTIFFLLAGVMILGWMPESSAAGGLVAQDDPALALGDYLFESGSLETSIVEYKRYLYFHPEGKRAEHAYRRMGLAYREMEAWAEAADAFRNAAHQAANDSISAERRIDLAVVLIASGNHSGAELELVRVSHFSRYASIKRRASFFLGVSCLYGYKWIEAAQAFDRYYQGLDGDPTEKAVDSLLASASELNYKSPSKARWFSTFVPGLGQIYAGDLKNGLNAMAINAATGYWFVEGLQHGTVADIITGYFLVFFRYYRGNRAHAFNIAREHNEKLNRNLAQETLDYLYRNSSR